MNPNDYQRLAMRTKADPVKILARLNELGPTYLQALIATNGHGNEHGEIADVIKAAVEYGKGPVDTVHLTEEIGDVLWRMAQLADAFGIKLEDCMRANIEKLKKRYPDTFSDYLANNRNLDAERKALEGRATPRGSAADEAFSMLFEKEPPQSFRTANNQPNASNVCKSSPRVVTECHEIGGVVFSPVNGAGFAEPPEEAETIILYPLDSEGMLDDKGWKFGMPTEPGDYDWFSPIHSLDPRKVTTHKNYSGVPGTWGRLVYWRKAAYNYPGWTLGIPVEAGRYEWFYVQTPFDYKISLIEVGSFSFTSVEVYYRLIPASIPLKKI